MTYHASMNKLSAMAAGSLFVLGAIVGAAGAADSLKVPMHLIDAHGVGKSIGTVTVSDTAGGVKLTVALEGLPPGQHGFHLHENPSCDAADKEGKPTPGEAAGGHYDPAGTKAHKGPGGGGHKGDLPKLVVDAAGTATATLDVKDVTMQDMAGRALVIHEGGDNYSDLPKPLGGGGARIACGVIPKS